MLAALGHFSCLYTVGPTHRWTFQPTYIVSAGEHSVGVSDNIPSCGNPIETDGPTRVHDGPWSIGVEADIDGDLLLTVSFNGSPAHHAYVTWDAPTDSDLTDPTCRIVDGFTLGIQWAPTPETMAAP